MKAAAAATRTSSQSTCVMPWRVACDAAMPAAEPQAARAERENLRIILRNSCWRVAPFGNR